MVIFVLHRLRRSVGSLGLLSRVAVFLLVWACVAHVGAQRQRAIACSFAFGVGQAVFR